MGKVIIEWKESRFYKNFVLSNIDFKGVGIKKNSNGKDHKRGLMGFYFTENALKKMLAIHKQAKYIGTSD